jgi:hypothetical protein
MSLAFEPRYRRGMDRDNLHEPPPPHVIRLRGPWQFDETAGARFLRPFNWPRATIPGPRVTIDLAIDGARGEGIVTLNDARLGTLSGAGSGRFGVTALLAMHNLLMIEFPRGDEPLELAAIGEVRLEIFDDEQDE